MRNPITLLVQLFLSSAKKANGDWDEIQIGGFACLVTLCGLSLIDLTYLHSAFSPTGFGGGAAAILGAMAGGKRIRDGRIPLIDQASSSEAVGR